MPNAISLSLVLAENRLARPCPGGTVAGQKGVGAGFVWAMQPGRSEGWCEWQLTSALWPAPWKSVGAQIPVNSPWSFQSLSCWITELHKSLTVQSCHLLKTTFWVVGMILIASMYFTLKTTLVEFWETKGRKDLSSPSWPHLQKWGVMLTGRLAWGHSTSLPVQWGLWEGQMEINGHSRHAK
jgi:hypothetical protein